MAEHYPLISCICVTRGKPLFLQRAVNSFLSQTYPNKELVILYDSDDHLTKRFIVTMPVNPMIKIMEVEKSPDIKLGHLRNMAIQAAIGAYICQWDDDDWSHAGRLEYQFAVVKGSGYPGCVMTSWIVFDATKSMGYISNFRLWEGSLFCRKDILAQECYENKSIAEDTALIQDLFSRDLLYLIMDVPHLYIYNYHGNNTWGHAHWQLIFKSSTLLDEATNHEIEKIMAQIYEPLEASALLDTLLKIDIFDAEE
jgi:glycosyltransferase involved in cell wall biosynthesis